MFAPTRKRLLTADNRKDSLSRKSQEDNFDQLTGQRRDLYKDGRGQKAR